jgi:predicted DNA-binding transcriptional regulator AlpA
MTDIQIAIISVAAFCASVDISIPTAYRWIKKGLLPKPVRLGPNRVGFRKGDVDAWLASRGEE